MRALLDVNVLIALLDASHMHHDTAMRWLEREQGHGWASCPITQNGCIRIMSQPAYPAPLPAAAVAARLAEAVTGPDHQFWPDDLNRPQYDFAPAAPFECGRQYFQILATIDPQRDLVIARWRTGWYQ